MRNAGLEEAQAGIKIARRNINNLRYADDMTLMAESEEELSSLLMKVKEESENVGLKLNIQKTKIMASGPISSQQIDGETVETVRNFITGGFKIIADGDCSHEIRKHLLLGRKVMTNLVGQSVQSLSCVRLCVQWTAACPASLSITNSQSPPKPMSIESVMPSNHLILCHPLLLLPSIFPSIRVFSNESANLDSLLKSRDDPLPTNVRLVKPMVSPVVMYGCES